MFLINLALFLHSKLFDCVLFSVVGLCLHFFLRMRRESSSVSSSSFNLRDFFLYEDIDEEDDDEEEGDVEGDKDDAEDTDEGECDFECLHL